MSDQGNNGIGSYRYEGYGLEEKLGWISQGAGTAALAEARAALSELGSDLIDSEHTLRALVDRLGGAWEGAAGSAAGLAMQQAAMWSGDSAPMTDQAGSGVDLQAESVQRTRNGMPEPAPRPEYGFGDALGDAFNLQTSNLFDVQTNFDEQVARRRAAEQEVNRLLYEHEAASRTNLATIPALAPAPRITVESVPPATVCPPVVPPPEPNVVPPVSLRPTEDGPTEDGPTDGRADRSQDATRRDQRADGEQRPEGDQDPRQDQRPDQQDRQQSPVRPQDFREDGVVRPDGPGRVAEPVDPVRPQLTSQQAHVDPTTAPRFSPALPGLGLAAGGHGAGGEFAGSARGLDGTAAVHSGRGPAPGPRSGAGAGSPWGTAGRAPGGGPAGTVRGTGTSLMPPAAGARGADDKDAEHSDRYYRHDDDLFRTDDIVVMEHGVIGEEPAR